jgi:uncharacterized membrane protein (DUF485 family)
LGARPIGPWNEESSVDEHDGANPGVLGVGEPWREAEASAWMPQPRPEQGAAAVRAAAYVEVQHSAAFLQVRDRYRRFAFPMVACFVGWYLLYVVAATTAPGLMGRRVSGELNVAMVAGLAQFATTFLLTWAYARHARLRRDRAALDLRWTLATRTGQERLR